MLDNELLIEIATSVRMTAAQENQPMLSMLYATSDNPEVRNAMMPWTEETTELEYACAALRLQTGHVFDEAAYVSDAYGISVDPGTYVPNSFPRHSLQDRFEAGDPDVYECVNICVVRRNGSNTMIQLRYVMVDNVPCFDEPRIEAADADIQGVVPDALRLLVTETLGCAYPNCTAESIVNVGGKGLCREHGEEFTNFLNSLNN